MGSCFSTCAAFSRPTWTSSAGDNRLNPGLNSSALSTPKTASGTEASNPNASKLIGLLTLGADRYPFIWLLLHLRVPTLTRSSDQAARPSRADRRSPIPQAVASLIHSCYLDASSAGTWCNVRACCPRRRIVRQAAEPDLQATDIGGP